MLVAFLLEVVARSYVGECRRCCRAPLIFVPVPALVIIAQEFVPGAPATASGMVLGLGSALAGIGYIVLGRVQETVGLTNGILIGFSMVVPAALISLVVLLPARDATPVAAH